jgi:hypothetical protein
MITKEQNIATNTLLAAAIGCFMQFTVGIFVLLSPLVFDNIIVPLIGQKESVTYFMAISNRFIKAPFVFILGVIILLVMAFLYLYASKNLRKNSKIKTWSIVSLIISFLLLYFDSSFLSIAAILGFIGSITGLMHDAQIKK